MTLREEGEPASQMVAAHAPDLWIEVLAPIEIAEPLIADALERSPMRPVGVVIARTGYGSIVLNQRAWTFLHPTLTSIQGLRTRHAAYDPMEGPAVDRDAAQICEIASTSVIDACESDSTSLHMFESGAVASEASSVPVEKLTPDESEGGVA